MGVKGTRWPVELISSDDRCDIETCVRTCEELMGPGPTRARPKARQAPRLSFSLAESLRKGPVVLYHFAAAFSEGCSIEAHQFAEAMPQFEALGARVIGVSTDDIETLTRFSVQACQGRFAVASDAGRTIVESYDAQMMTRPDYANRISCVIAPNGSVLFSYLSLNPNKHVEKMLDALRQWQQSGPRK